MSLKKNFSFMAVGRGVYAVCQWLLIVVVARLTNPGDLGDFSYALAVTGPVIVFSQFNMRAYIATDARRDFGFSDYLRARILSTLLALLLIVVFCLYADNPAQTNLLILCVAIYKAVESVSNIYYGALQRDEVMLPIAKSIAAHGLLSVAAMFTAIWLAHSVTLGTVAIAAGWLAILLFYDCKVARPFIGNGQPETDRRFLSVIQACFPLGLVLALMSLRMNAPAYFIRDQLGTEQLGYYSAAAYFMFAGTLLTGSLVQTAAPRLSRHMNDGDFAGFYRLLTRMLLVAAGLATAGVVIALVAGDWILGTLYGRAYADQAGVLAWVMGAAGLGYGAQFLGLALTVARKFGFQVFSGAAGVVVVFVLCYALIPAYGTVGGAMALAGAALVMLLGNGVLVWVALNPRRKSQVSYH